MREEREKGKGEDEVGRKLGFEVEGVWRYQ